MIRFHDFSRRCKRYQRPLEQAINRVFNRGWLILGPELKEFEEGFARVPSTSNTSSASTRVLTPYFFH